MIRYIEVTEHGVGALLGVPRIKIMVLGCVLWVHLLMKKMAWQGPPKCKGEQEKLLLKHGVLDKKQLNEGRCRAINSPS